MVMMMNNRAGTEQAQFVMDHDGKIAFVQLPRFTVPPPPGVSSVSLQCEKLHLIIEEKPMILAVTRDEKGAYGKWEFVDGKETPLRF